MKEADVGKGAIQDTMDIVNRIKEQVGSIAEKTYWRLTSKPSKSVKSLKTVNDLADQSNLLALNATIEAARAGEAGKGFRRGSRRGQQPGRPVQGGPPPE